MALTIGRCHATLCNSCRQAVVVNVDQTLLGFYDKKKMSKLSILLEDFRVVRSRDFPLDLYTVCLIPTLLHVT